MPLTNKDIENILYIQFENISKYMKYDDYYIFYQLYAPKNINKLIRKCIYCNKVPICPINISHKKYKLNNKCNTSILNPLCYTCVVDNWAHNYNKLSYKNKLKNRYTCPHKCCSFNNNYNQIIKKRNEYLFDFENSWGYLKKIPYYKCKYCGLTFRNKYNFDIYKHLKTSTCRVIIMKIISGLDQLESESESESESNDITNYENEYYFL
jgi:hypothetical protein